MCCSKKRIISLIVSLLMIVSLIGGLPMKNGVNADGEVPVLNSVSVYPTTIQKGQEVKLKVTLHVNAFPTGINEVLVKATPLFGKKAGELFLLSEPITTTVTSAGYFDVYIPIDENVLSGEYRIFSVEIGDKSNHTSIYRVSTSEGTYVEDSNSYISEVLYDTRDNTKTIYAPTFKVEGTDKPVYEPELTSISMLGNSVNAPGTIQVELGVSSSDPYINGYSVDYFYLNDKVGSGLNPHCVPSPEDCGSPSEGKYIVDLKLDKFAHPGDYQISRVTLYDSLGNEKVYDLGPISHGETPPADLQNGTYFESTKTYVSGKLTCDEEIFDAPKFKVTGGTAGNAYTELDSVSYVSSSVNRPGVAKIQLMVKDDVGVSDATVQFTPLQGYGMGYDDFGGSAENLDVKDGTITIDVPIDETNYLGKYQPSYIYFTNKRGIVTGYKIEKMAFDVDRGACAGYSGTYDEEARAFISDTLKFADVTIKVPALTLTDVDDYYFRSSNQNNDLVNMINHTPNGTTIGVHIDDSSNGLLTQAVFYAIMGRDIRLVAYKDSYQWVFYGRDINYPKNVNLFLTVEQMDKSVYGTTEDSVKVGFYPNGLLPGRALIRLKSDYLYNLKGIRGKLYLYYNNNGVMEIQNDPSFDLTLDGADKWCSFAITHNSEYIISGSEVNTNVQSGGSGSGSGSSSSGSGSSSSEPEKPKYSNEWIKGKWYSADGSQTYEGILEWKCNSTGWWVEDTSGWYPQSAWQKIDGIWYYFNSDGYMASSEYYGGYWFNGDGSWDEAYYLTWKSNSTGWWVEDKSGWWPASQWLKIDGSWYYFDSSGYMVTSQYVDGYWIGADGVCN